eukprot:GHVS01026588.1.p1 GENE.GHVS01026588.1~~GHVS01026588.1.p1  ORF type:complete len:455 (-),score=54.28 GHVS01026588.1:1347-2711(-)
MVAALSSTRTNGSVSWKMRNEKAYRNLSLEFPVRVLDFRSSLRQLLHINNVPSLDVVVYNADDPDRCLSDYHEVRPNLCFLVARMQAAEAAVILAEVNTAEKASCHALESAQPAATVPSTTAQADTTSHPASSGADSSGTDSSRLNTSNPYDALPLVSPSPYTLHKTPELDEDARIRAVMAQHAQHRGPSGMAGNQESLAHRYLRNKNWSWTKEGGESMPENGPPGKRVLLPAFLSNKGVFRGTSSGRGGGPGGRGGSFQTAVINVGLDYVCHMCGHRGHHIKNCSRSHDNRHQKRVKPATGIPVNFLKRIDPDDIPNYSDVYVLKDGNFAVMKNIEAVSGGAYFSKTLDQKITHRLGTSGGGSLGGEGVYGQLFKCSLCSRLFNKPVLTSCCGETFCRSCVHVGQHCPGCRSKVLTEMDLEENRAIQDSVDAILKRTDTSAAAAAAERVQARR